MHCLLRGGVFGQEHDQDVPHDTRIWSITLGKGAFGSFVIIWRLLPHVPPSFSFRKQLAMVGHFRFFIPNFGTS